MRRRFGLFFLMSLLMMGSAYAQTSDCADITALQRWVGYLSWLGFFKGLGAVVIATGVLIFMGGLIVDFLYHTRLLLEMFAYVSSAALVGGGYWVPPEYLTWTVFVGCILFMGSVYLTICIHEIESDDPRILAAVFMVVWGAIAIYYNMMEVGIIAILALMVVLGFSVMIDRFSYGFGWHDEGAILPGTTAALIILVGFVVQRCFYPDAPAYVQVFAPGAFWTGTIVAFTGLLIMSSKWYDDGVGYFPMQVATITIYLGGVAAGLILNINPLAGASGTFLALYLTAKPMEVQNESMTGFGVALMCSGAIMFGMWYLAMQNLDTVKPYLTTTL